MFTGNSNFSAFRQAVKISKFIYNGIKCRRYGNSNYIFMFNLCHFCSASLCQEIIYTKIMFLGDRYNVTNYHVLLWKLSLVIHLKTEINRKAFVFQAGLFY